MKNNSSKTIHSANLFFLMVGVVLLVSFQNCSKVDIAPYQSLEYQKTVKLVADFYASPGYSLSHIFAINLSARLQNYTWITDYDRDGLSDLFENDIKNSDLYNIAAATSDTNEDGFSDLTMVRLGYGAAVQNSIRPCADKGQDTDKDGLTDCEENLLGTDSKKFDTDADGIPDAFEVTFGINPLDSSDALIT